MLILASGNWVVNNLENAIDTWNDKLSEIWQIITQSPEAFKGGTIWQVILKINGAVQAIGLALLVLFFVIGVVKTCSSLADVKKPEHAIKLFVRFAIAKGIVTYGLDLMLSIFKIVQGVISTIMKSAGFGTVTKTILPQEIVKAVESCGFFESIPLWAVTLIGGLFVTVLSFIMILTVYGRFFKLYLYTAIAPVNGKRKYINKSGFRTKSEAIEAGNKAYNEYKTAGVPFKECNISYSDYLDYWLENYCKVNLKYNTIQSYKSLINKYIKPKIGMYKLSTITSVGLNTYISNLCEEYDFSRSYFKNILKVVKGSFRDACTKYGLIKYDPAIQLRLPKMDKYEEDIKHLYSKEEIERILERFKDNSPFTCAFLTSCFTGMRTGEVFALTWDDIDFENKIIDVKHSIYDKPKDIKGRWYIGTTKTFKGKRKIYMSETLCNALINFKKRQDYIKKISGLNYNYYHIEDVVNEYGKKLNKELLKVV